MLKQKLRLPWRKIGLSKAILALEDGTVLEGEAFGAPARRSGTADW
jgi:hypothetical protein